ncbi:MAG: type III-B CRISPR-associated protein Cas10/Cmr2 [Planctomycetaceae bacterium]|jgi:CRISPR-associated protein Cmr2|nr:type III-B CRISPR-associated protein Cas10/Cmr2 [Planctomycetaceae bacterium]
MTETTNKKYLLAISIGPVQGFIAAARKTRDLWFGSHILSEIAKAAAREIVNTGGELIFPGVSNNADTTVLAPNTPLAVANVILAIVNVTGTNDENKRSPIHSYVDKIETATKKRWLEFVEQAIKKIEEIGLNEKLNKNLWDQQVGDFIEFYAAWTSFDGVHDDYSKKRQHVMRLLAGRKKMRDFKQSSGVERIEKSSLDGARETVFPKELPDEFYKPSYLRKGEYLDAISAVKRFAAIDALKSLTSNNSFQSTLEIAVAPLGNKSVDIVKKHKEKINDDGNEIDIDDPALKELAEKSPYFAIVHADGDRMGRVISALNAPEKHCQLSKSLREFSDNVKNIIKKYKGECVYSGGDDMLGFLPLHNALECTRELHDDFADKLKNYKCYNVSLSVGLVIVHYHEMLDVLLKFARNAEKTAKRPNNPKQKDVARFGDRNGLAIEVYSRSGAPIRIREQWDNQNSSEDAIDKRIQTWSKEFAQQKISSKFPYDLRELGKLYNDNFDSKLQPGAIQSAVLQMIRHKDIASDKLKDWVVNNVDSAGALKFLSGEMLIAQFFGRAKKLIGTETK